MRFLTGKSFLRNGHMEIFLFKGFILSFETIHHLYEYEKRLQDRFTQISSQKLSQKKILHINNEFNQFDFDPRIGGTSESIMINKLLFDGLTRKNKKGEIALSCANSYHLSSDRKTYTFQLKELYWSNGQLLTAYDFEYAWKKILSPDFETRFAYLFFIIMNAEEAKKGKVSLDDVGITALNEKTLQVRINHPAPYFLELLAHSLFSPVNLDLDRTDPSWSYGRNHNFVCNGPFKLKSPRPFYEFEFERNPYYWNREEIALEGISISNVNSQKALEMFKNQELDWLGPPFGIPKQEFMECSDKISYLPVSKAFWCCFNVNSLPLSNKKIRQAIFYSVDRKKMIQGIQGKNEPAYSPLPKEHTLLSPTKYLDIENKEKARHLFAEGLREIGISRKVFPAIKFIFFDNELFHQIARNFKEQIEESLGIQCLLLKVDYNEFFYRLEMGDYEIGAMRWSSWANDPMYTLEIFRNANEKMNFINWEHSQYQSLMESAQNEEDLQKRSQSLSQAEKILIDEFVILSLFYGQDIILKNSNLNICNQNQMGVMDFSLLKFET